MELAHCKFLTKILAAWDLTKAFDCTYMHDMMCHGILLQKLTLVGITSCGFVGIHVSVCD